jgi:hypothetical protein
MGKITSQVGNKMFCKKYEKLVAHTQLLGRQSRANQGKKVNETPFQQIRWVFWCTSAIPAT